MFACLYNAFLLSMFVSVLLFQNTWLEMRVNLGHVFFALIAVIFALQLLIRPVRKFCKSTLILVISCAGSYLVLGYERLKIILASIIREGIMQNRISFSAINHVLIIMIIAGWLLTLIFKNGR